MDVHLAIKHISSLKDQMMKEAETHLTKIKSAIEEQKIIFNATQNSIQDTVNCMKDTAQVEGNRLLYELSDLKQHGIENAQNFSEVNLPKPHNVDSLIRLESKDIAEIGLHPEVVKNIFAMTCMKYTTSVEDVYYSACSGMGDNGLGSLLVDDG